MGVVLDMMHLIPGKRRRIVNLDQHITTPSGAISLDVTHSGLGPSPVVAPGEGLERSSPGLVEFGFADCAAVLKSLEIQLAHNLTLPPLISPGRNWPSRAFHNARRQIGLSGEAMESDDASPPCRRTWCGSRPCGQSMKKSGSNSM